MAWTTNPSNDLLIINAGFVGTNFYGVSITGGEWGLYTTADYENWEYVGDRLTTVMVGGVEVMPVSVIDATEYFFPALYDDVLAQPYAPTIRLSRQREIPYGSITLQQVTEEGVVKSSTNYIHTLQFDEDSGLNLTNTARGAVRVFVGSHWYGIGAGGETNYPTSAQDIQFAVSTNIADITWNTNTEPWTLTWPNIPGPQGVRGYPGYSFVYAGGYSCVETYTTNMSVSSGGGLYGCIATNWIAPNCTSTPPDYPSIWITLASPGTDGTDGTDGGTLPYYGAWVGTTAYSTGVLVRAAGGVYYSELASSNINPQTATNASTYWSTYLIDGSDGNDGVITTNAFFGDPLVYNAAYAYVTNQVVSYSGELYICLVNNSAVNQQTPSSSPAYWTRIVTRGATGSTGAAGKDGSDGADASGVYWGYAYQSDHAYT
ncbi:MAG: hypothetical protein EOM24_29140, partial [Chloroflexia bacterium]|nr:hypothetical protein [Chloroflexia bacterium]